MTNAPLNMTVLSQSPCTTRKFLAASALALVALTGCAALAPATPEATVTARAQQRWKSLMASDWSAAHAFLTPAFRSTMPVDRYKERFVGAPKWKNVTVKSATCKLETCTVVVRIEALVGVRSGMTTLSTDMPETWLQENGQWYKYENM